MFIGCRGILQDPALIERILTHVRQRSEEDLPLPLGARAPRLADVKARFDPENRCRRNQNVQPRARRSLAATRT